MYPKNPPKSSLETKLGLKHEWMHTTTPANLICPIKRLNAQQTVLLFAFVLSMPTSNAKWKVMFFKSLIKLTAPTHPATCVPPPPPFPQRVCFTYPDFPLKCPGPPFSFQSTKLVASYLKFCTCSWISARRPPSMSEAPPSSYQSSFAVCLWKGLLFRLYQF